MTAFINFLVGGGLLALVQAVLATWNVAQAKQAGENAANLSTAQKALTDAQTAQKIDSDVSTLPISAVRNELQQFERD